jgi:hypothetical protein
MPTPGKRTQREVRRSRHSSAWIVLPGSAADQECQVLDISMNGAKVIAEMPSHIPSRFELAFTQGDPRRRLCEVIWRRGKMIGVQFF